MSSTVTTGQLIREAMASIEQAGTDEGTPTPVVLDSPSTERVGWGGPVEWHPLVALAVAGHIVQHWSDGWQHKGPFEVETGSPIRRTAVLHYPGTPRFASRRLMAGGHPDDGIRVRELCGHRTCMEDAPAGPGSRCPAHFGDPVEGAHWDHTRWARIAAEAWRTKHPTAGEEKVMLDNERNHLIAAALGVGMRPIDLHRATGIARTTIDRVADSQPAPEPA
ncbi:hypothetical protein [Kitasatospora sp. MBT66]|uniref:hypothetical protein n=1 Tax=Kitasatospora sp. MBT66 TaxID=1444769 RepID=UPI0005B7ABB3|nr:hypothetical protein [Kitasatospora sp. MBT66]